MTSIAASSIQLPALTNEFPVFSFSAKSLEAYITSANHAPMLTMEEEQTFARKFRDLNDLNSASNLVLSHLRLVVSVARQYLGYGLPHSDLIQEGNIGLMKAVKRFDPDQGVRLVSYAMHWIKAEINDYILKNWRMVKVASTKAQRKLFFNLRSMKQRFKAEEGANSSFTHRESLTPNQIHKIATELNVKPEEVMDMEMKFSGGDIVIDPVASGDDEAFGPISYLTDTNHEPTELIESYAREEMLSTGLTAALDTLDQRSRRVVQARWLDVNDDASGGLTLHDLAAEFGVSAERIRQIEVAAFKKMKIVLTA